MVCFLRFPKKETEQPADASFFRSVNRLTRNNRFVLRRRRPTAKNRKNKWRSSWFFFFSKYFDSFENPDCFSHLHISLIRFWPFNCEKGRKQYPSRPCIIVIYISNELNKGFIGDVQRRIEGRKNWMKIVVCCYYLGILYKVISINFEFETHFSIKNKKCRYLFLKLIILFIFVYKD